MKKILNNDYFFIILNLITAIFFSLILFKFTPNGLGASADSVGYIKAATGLISGKYLDYFTNVWPPLYSFLLAIFGFIFDNDVIYGGRVLNSITLGINYLLFFKLFSKLYVNKYIIFTLAIVSASHPLVVEIHLYAWTEPLFTSFFVINLLLLNKFLSAKSNSQLFITALIISVITGFAILLRYAGVTILIGNIITFTFFYLFKKLKLQTYLFYLSTQILIPILIYSPWYLYSARRFNNSTGTNFGFNHIDFEKILIGLKTIGSWFLNIDFLKHFNFISNLYIALGIFIIFSIVIYFFISMFKNFKIQNINQNQNQNFKQIVSISIISYLIFIVLSSTFINIATPLDNRILSPIFTLILFQVLFYISLLSPTYLQTILLLFFIFIVSSPIHKFKGAFYFSSYNGFEFSNPKWQQRSIINFLKLCPSSSRVFSDAPWSINLFISPNALWLPRKISYTSGVINSNFDSEIVNLSFGTDIIVLINEITEYSPLISNNNFRKIYSGPDGQVWLNNKSLITCNKNIVE